MCKGRSRGGDAVIRREMEGDMKEGDCTIEKDVRRQVCRRGAVIRKGMVREL